MKTLKSRKSLLEAGVSLRQVQTLLDGKYINVYNQVLANVSSKLKLSEDELIDVCGNIYDFEQQATKSADLVPLKKKEAVEEKEVEWVGVNRSLYKEITEKFNDKSKFEVIWLLNGVSIKRKDESKNIFVYNENRFNKEGQLIGTLVMNSLAKASVPKVIEKKLVYIKGTMPSVRSVTVAEAASILSFNSLS